MNAKQRFTVTADADLIRAGKTAVAEGQAGNFSAWVNDAMRLKAENDARLRALDRFFEEYEREHGEITEGEIKAATKRLKSRAIDTGALLSGQQA
jgi:hypothetical protein